VLSSSAEECADCLATFSPSLASAYLTGLTDCSNAATPCTAECNNVYAAETCSAGTAAGLAAYGCYCPALLSSGLACSACLASIDPTGASAIGSAVTVCSVTDCYPECSSLYLLSCGGVSSCYCPVYRASAAGCSACAITNFPTFASQIASILTTECGGTGGGPVATNPTLPSQTQSVAQQTAASTPAHSGARAGFGGILGEHYMGIIIAIIAIVASVWSVFM
jgi:hypothetical protein